MADADVLVSPLSRTVTLDGVTVDVRIYQPSGSHQWALLVILESGWATIWEQPFNTEVDALAAFHVAVQEEGMEQFLEDGDPPTLH